jgi:hypothetical protein
MWAAVSQLRHFSKPEKAMVASKAAVGFKPNRLRQSLDQPRMASSNLAALALRAGFR